MFQAAGDNDRVVDEFILNFTHDVAMEWLLPGVEPTGKQVKLPIVTVAQFEADSGIEVAQLLMTCTTSLHRPTRPESGGNPPGDGSDNGARYVDR